MKQTIPYINSYQLSYAEYGNKSGFPILVQHGLIASIDDQTLFDLLLQRNARMVCIARPGYGESSPYAMSSYAEWGEIISPLVQKLGLTHFDLLGISSGAPYAYSIAYNFLEHVRNIYILNGMPALYDEMVLSEWPYPIKKAAGMVEMEALAHELFFANLSEMDMENPDVRDSMRNNAFGVAQDLRLRGLDWGFRLSGVNQKVFMQHSKSDEAVPFQTAVRTAALLPNCDLELKETGVHFSKEVLNEFIERVILPEMNTNKI